MLLTAGLSERGNKQLPVARPVSSCLRDEAETLLVTVRTAGNVSEHGRRRPFNLPLTMLLLLLLRLRLPLLWQLKLCRVMLLLPYTVASISSELMLFKSRRLT